MVKVVCAVIINENKEILLAQRSENMSHPGQWEFPGGKIQQKESPETALKREIAEELLCDIEILKKFDEVKWDYLNKSIELSPYLCRLRQTKIVLTEHAAIQWLRPKDILTMDNLLAADRKILENEIWD